MPVLTLSSLGSMARTLSKYSLAFVSSFFKRAKPAGLYKPLPDNACNPFYPSSLEIIACSIEFSYNGPAKLAAFSCSFG